MDIDAILVVLALFMPLFIGGIFSLALPRGIYRLVFLVYNFYYFLYYCFTPLLVISGLSVQKELYSDATSELYSATYAMYVFIFILVVDLSYIFLVSLVSGKKPPPPIYYFKFNKWAMGLMGIIGFLVFLSSVGSFEALIAKMYFIRSGAADVNLMAVISKRFAGLLIFAYYMALYDYYTNKRNLAVVLLFLVFAVLIAFTNGGRGDLVWLAIISYLVKIYATKKHNYFMLFSIIMFLALYIFLLGGGGTSQLFSHESGKNLFIYSDLLSTIATGFLDEAIFCSYSFAKAIEYVNQGGEFTFFFDWITIFGLLGVYQGLEYPSISYFNTFQVASLVDRSTVPPGALGYGLYAFREIGLFVVSFLTSFILFLGAYTLRVVRRDDSLFILVAVLLFFIISFLVVNFDFRIFILRYSVVIFVILLGIRKIKYAYSRDCNILRLNE